MIEKRKYIRIPSKLLMMTFFENNKDRIVPDGVIYSDDISVEGLRMIYSQQLSKGTAIQLRLFLFSDPIPVFVQGKVVWSQKVNVDRGVFTNDTEIKNDHYCRAGMQLINVNSFERERIRRWINKKLTMVKV